MAEIQVQSGQVWEIIFTNNPEYDPNGIKIIIGLPKHELVDDIGTSSTQMDEPGGTRESGSGGVVVSLPRKSMDIEGGQVWEYYERFPERKMAVGDARDPFAANGLQLYDRFTVGYFDKDKRVWRCVSYKRQIWEIQDIECPPPYLFYDLRPGDKFWIKSIGIKPTGFNQGADTLIVLPDQRTIEISWRFLCIFSRLVPDDGVRSNL